MAKSWSDMTITLAWVLTIDNQHIPVEIKHKQFIFHSKTTQMQLRSTSSSIQEYDTNGRNDKMDSSAALFILYFNLH